MRPIVALVLLVLATLPSLAYASPPDSSWIPGLYDDADYDDVVVLVASEIGNVGPVPFPDLRPILSTARHVPRRPEQVEHSLQASVVRLRAPPAS